MNTLDKIIELLDKNNLQQKDLTDSLGLEKSTFSAWKNGKSSSYKKYLPEIARFFGISVDELVGATTNSKSSEIDDVYFSFAKRAQSEGIKPEDIELAISTIKAMRAKNKGE